jgi:hypothetical protein
LFRVTRFREFSLRGAHILAHQDRDQQDVEKLEKMLEEQHQPQNRQGSQSSQSTGTGGGGSAAIPERGPAENLKEAGVDTGDLHTAPGASGPTGSQGTNSGLQPGGMKPAAGRFGGMGSLGTGGAQTGPGSGETGATNPPDQK